MDVKLNKIATCSCILLIYASLGNTNQINFFIAGGPGFSTLKNTRLVEINEEMTNAYNTIPHTNRQSFWAIGAHHALEHFSLPSYQLSLGLAGYFFHLGQVKGTEYPFINEGFFDTLDYSFHAKSVSLMMEAKAVFSPYALKPYALIGIGSGWNKFYAYNEKPTDPTLSAAPAMFFNNHTQQIFSYELGAGIQYLLKDDPLRHVQYYASAGYQYFNLNKGSLGPSPAQASSDRIKVKNLYTQGIIFTLALSLG
ncbi:hypothetical protein [uncultured Legionella sp.]|uniref:hypothetical protein n=1 Tax=uncultured Legionella sp. TaxID=210934 RepID=UPI00262A4A03|nr:hypothetical protein [uncultured Legionella sp.]